VSTDGTFPPTSRYYGLAIKTFQGKDGKSLVYVSRRFLPNPASMTVLQEHEVREGDRLDNLAASLLGDPEQFWRIADANGAMRPDELTETEGRRLVITLPEGITGPK
jgi:hypothetical protein